MGRAPCCDKANVKKGPWAPEEDAKLKAYIEQHGTGGNWIALPKKIGLKRCGKSCRLRWLNYLRPNIKHGGFSEEEDKIICSLYISIGSRWSIIAAQLPGRTDNDIKNYWNTRLKKKLLGKQRKEQQVRRDGCFKQEMKRESASNLMVTGLMDQTPYWPELPVATAPVNPQQLDYHFKDEYSLRSLLIKLGGRFSDDYQPSMTSTSSSVQYPYDSPFSQDQFYDNTISILSSPTSMKNSNGSQLPNSQFSACSAMSQSLENFPVELSHQLAYSNQQQLDELERFYGMNVVNGSTGSTSAETTSWEDISSFVYRTIPSDYETCQQSIPRDSTFEEPRTTFPKTTIRQQ